MRPFHQVRRPRMAWFAWFAWCLAIAGAARAAEPVPWKTPPAFGRQLNEPIGISWQDRALAAGLARLAESTGVAVFLDRRIDPGQSVTLAVRDQPLHSVLQQAAAAAQAGITTLGPLVYVGPPATTSQLATIAALRRQEAAKFTAEQKTRLLRQQAWQWSELTQPRELLADLAREAGVTVINAEAIPHDLWPAVSLPPLPWTDRLTLLLAGFGLTFEFDDRGTAVRLTPLPAAVVVEQSGPAARASLPARNGKAVKGGGDTVYSLQVANEPAGKVVRKVAESLGKELKYDDRTLEKLRQPVTLEVKNASLNYLLETTLKPLGLTYRVTDHSLEIIPQP